MTFLGKFRLARHYIIKCNVTYGGHFYAGISAKLKGDLRFKVYSVAANWMSGPGEIVRENLVTAGKFVEINVF